MEVVQDYRDIPTQEKENPIHTIRMDALYLAALLVGAWKKKYFEASPLHRRTDSAC